MEHAPADRLRTDGLHQYVRHPLYLGTFVFLWGLFLVFPNASMLITILVIQGYTLIALRFEEAKLLQVFGDDYQSYMLRVPRIWPRIQPRSTKKEP
jgi:protein-S-isoprenylcysteine O-methyltransferase Ste14